MAEKKSDMSEELQKALDVLQLIKKPKKSEKRKKRRHKLFKDWHYENRDQNA